MTPETTDDQRAEEAFRRRVHRAVARWYAAAGRDLPWRRPQCSAWGIYVSEVMAQQTPISRILAPWQAWMERWPTPADLAAAETAEVIRAWDRLGYPRRAIALQAAARTMVERHGGQVPSSAEELRALPGVGDYTVAAVSSFAFGIPLTVIDTNVRRVLARVALGQAQAGPSPTRSERDLADAWMPHGRAAANTWNVAAMELGALVCTARAPRCGECPVARLCRWHLAGHPAYTGAVKKPQGYAGTDRQLRGQVMALARQSPRPLRPQLLLSLAAPGRMQAILDALVREGLLSVSGEGYHLPR